MKKILMTLSLLAAPLAFSATVTETSMSVPFAFRAGESNMPAGKYRIRTERTPAGFYRVFVLSTDGKLAVMPSMMIDEQMPPTPETGLIFNCENKADCQLREVHNSNGQSFRVR